MKKYLLLILFFLGLLQANAQEKKRDEIMAYKPLEMLDDFDLGEGCGMAFMQEESIQKLSILKTMS